MDSTAKKPIIKKIIEKFPEGEDDIVDDDVWTAVKAFVEENGFNSSQIKHYNLFIYEKAQQVVDHFRCVKIEENGKTYMIEFGEIFFNPPYFVESDDSGKKLYPTVALQRNITYSSALYVDITITPPSGEPSFYEKQPLGHVPVMVLSDLCNMTAIFNDPIKMASHNENFMDVGGYFVIAPKGDSSAGTTAQRRVLGSQERASSNRIQVFTTKRKQHPKFNFYAEVKSSGNGMHTTTTTVGILGNNKRISTVLPWIDMTEIPLGVVFRALGIEDETEMAILILGSKYEDDRESLKFLLPTLEYSYECNTQESALIFIGKKAKKITKEEDLEENQDEEENTEEEKETEKNKKKSDEKIRSDAIFYAKRLLSADLFPHVGSGENTFVEKAKYLGYMVQKLIWVVLGRRKPECRDHYMNKRISTPATLLAQQFYGAFRRLITEITNNTKKALKTGNSVNILSWIKPSIITNAMNGAISGNNWSSGGPASKGISQLYEEFNHASCAANMRKLTVPMAAEGGKVIEPRDLHGSHFGVACPSETPEGKKAGLVKNMAFTSLITVGSDPEPVKKIVKSILGSRAERHYPESLSWSRVFLNGTPIGETEKPDVLVKSLINARRNGKINAETSIAYFAEYNEVQIAVDGGRLCRPLFIVTDGELNFKISDAEKLVIGELTWTQLLSTGMVELVDKAEEENYLVIGFPSDLEKMREGKSPSYLDLPPGAISDFLKKVTHCEIHPSLMYGIGGSIIPFPDHNQSPRNCYQSSMGKQAIGIPFTNYQQVMSGTFHTMEYLQKPLCLSRAGSIVRFDEMPAGQNAIIAVMPRPYNEEDSIEMNKDAVDRGFMVSNKWTCYYSEIRGEKREHFGIPTEENCDRLRGNAKNIGKEGFPLSGTTINTGDVIIGKIIENELGDALTISKKKKYTDASTVYDHPWPARVARIQLGTTGDGYQYIRVMLCQRRVPIVGDKFCYSPDHEVLTTDGWVKIFDVNMEHKVATLNSKGELEYQNPTEVMSFDHDGEMIVSDPGKGGVNLRVTLNHNMYARRKGSKDYKLEKAENLASPKIFGSGIYYKQNAKWKNSDVKYIYLKYPDGIVRKSSADSWLVVYGLIFAGINGNYAGPLHQELYDVDSSFSNSMKNALAVLKIRYTKFSIPEIDIDTFGISDENFSFLLDSFQDCDSWLWSLSARQCKILLRAMFSRGPIETCLVSERDLITRLALHAGWSTKCEYQEEYSPKFGFLNYKGCWLISVTRTSERFVTEQNIESYLGKVHCVTVPNHVIYVRRSLEDGKSSHRSVWCGNSARHGQKGTIGKLVPSYDLPFNSQGISPDILVNSLAFPSRMTIAMLMELLAGKVIISTSPLHEITVNEVLGNDSHSDPKGKGEKCKTQKLSEEFASTFLSPTDPTCIDATPYRATSNGESRINIVRSEMAKYGFDCGDESMTDGITGKKLRCLIFFGPVFYQRLKHLAIDKVHGRARGGRTTLMRQPKEKVFCSQKNWKLRLSEC